MFKLLYKIGGWFVRNKFKVFGGWIIIMIVILGIVFFMKLVFSEEMIILGIVFEKVVDIIFEEFLFIFDVGLIWMIFGVEGKEKFNFKEV